MKVFLIGVGLIGLLVIIAFLMAWVCPVQLCINNTTKAVYICAS